MAPFCLEIIGWARKLLQKLVAPLPGEWCSSEVLCYAAGFQHVRTPHSIVLALERCVMADVKH